MRGWIRGGDELHDHLVATVSWQPSQIYRYDHYVDERRLGAGWRPGQPAPHPVLLDAHRRLQHAYGVRFDGFGLIRYRDGEDGQGFHRDRELRWLDDTIIAVLSPESISRTSTPALGWSAKCCVICGRTGPRALWASPLSGATEQIAMQAASDR